MGIKRIIDKENKNMDMKYSEELNEIISIKL